MSDVAIRVFDLGKQYRIGGTREPYKTFREAVTGVASAPLRVFSRNGHGTEENTFWALKDVNFEIKRGEVVGVIGRNGAGKSTLLKILSRITEPTTGGADIYGRVGSLLEVGTGFHSELTGRENIYLSGAILGMRRVEIDKRFDEIVAFAEVEKFIDTPVKHYSSGMYLRLAFAVAAHLEPEILLVDEVLAVGDAAFQKKCLGKMGDVAKEGRTVLFVSHNMTAVKNLCPYSIYLKGGNLILKSDTEEVVDSYFSDLEHIAKNVPLKDRKDRRGDGRVKVVDFYVINEQMVLQNVLRSGLDYTFVMDYEKNNSGDIFHNTVGSIGITDSDGRIILLYRSNFTNQNFDLKEKKGAIKCQVKDFNLAPGIYDVITFLSNNDTDILDFVDNAAQIIVESGDYFGTGKAGLSGTCKVLSRADWRVDGP